MSRLSVNVDHVATLRQARGGREPQPLTAALLAQLGGADGITVHLREDRRHIQDADVSLLRQQIDLPLNLEMAATAEMVAIACHVGPDLATLVPEKRQELTTEGGLDVASQPQLKDRIAVLQQAGIRVSLFIDADPRQIELAAEVGADIIEIHTGVYCNAGSEGARAAELVRMRQAIRQARGLGLQVSAGHGLNYQNVAAVAALGEISEFNIGHSIVARAVLVGMERAVREMKSLLQER
ncbi:MAG: pyridoxine 5'-phosphate synthase [Desulfuromonas sp.]|uniref:pyridoxine 5'-phosphate synthase n=1 Tax=Desulfuromonas thiophila TaxID=57664 RepID=UPI0024A903C5|nr:pyridoxine 5'-phosphate synthase [Desulfuromonas thiophila]